MLQVLKHNQAKQYIESQGLKFLVLSSVAEYEAALLKEVDAVILGDMEQRDTAQLLKEVRRSRDKQLYLKPIFSVMKNDPSNSEGFDGFTDLISNKGIAEKARKILAKIDEVNSKVVPHDFERQTLFKQMAFMYTRDQLLGPITDRYSKIGYAFPFIESLLTDGASLTLINILKLGLDQGLMTTKLVDKIHTCNECQGNYLNFREVCPKCSSVDIVAKDLVHHFKCAHVDVIDKFQNGDELTCPKCDSKLRHIGIDYDKPSTMYSCNDCHHQFQDSDMQAFCIDCGKEEDTANLLESEINTYALSERGEHLVINGWENEQDNQHIEHLSLELFRIMLGLEIQRSKASSRSVFVKFDIHQSVVSPLGKEGREQFQREILGIVKSYVAATDLLSTKNAQEYFILLNDNTLEEAQEKCQIIEHNLTKLIADNLTTKEDLVLGSLQQVTSDLKVEHLT
ncbi:MAG: hypothetical protein OXH57_09690 [Ekhidna sp.]|nr:hypothetical protein [Ekhidna sp.]